MGRANRAVVSYATALAGLAVLVACTELSPPQGEETFRQYCAGCHGRGGVGNGPWAARLPVPPADLTVLRAANDGVFPVEHVMATVHGYPGKHDFSVMPEFGPLLEGPKQIWVSSEGEEIMTPVALLELVSYVETLQR
ncbi:c-type cytochrome [Marimonas arenosa]|uniref:Cytochrome c n=1 Tax=Marimonas arenosa TaxID=1795305 RepID=A0AAE3WEK9_9RHOB|nr:cytochrome c [Marimonas arenosa]MDQ2091586.1 cytochrome c [Marimonas arenosa]